ncbi:MAG: hypothetical protein GY855_17205 [candidate division Zixibacteria bacterium]|nr:hypothetical protein [candidate division Zixibacteria bacterium]
MKKTFILLIILVLCSGIPLSVCTAERINITVPGADFSPFSKGCIKAQRAKSNSCLLNAINKGEYAIYDFELRADALKISSTADISNPAHRDIDVFIYNYGKKQEADLLSKPELEGNWIRWETVLVDTMWHSRSPEFLDAVTSKQEFDLLGPHNIVRLLFYADPGVPPKNEVFFINSVSLIYETSVDFSDSDLNALENVWREGDRLYASGIGHPPENAINKAQSRAMTIRAATTDAQRNMLGYINEISSSVQNGKIIIEGVLTGASTHATKYFEDGSVQVTIVASTKRLIKRQGN